MLYFNLSRGKAVHIVGPFKSIQDFLFWTKQEEIKGNFKVLEEKKPAIVSTQLLENGSVQLLDKIS